MVDKYVQLLVAYQAVEITLKEEIAKYHKYIKAATKIEKYQAPKSDNWAMGECIQEYTRITGNSVDLDSFRASNSDNVFRMRNRIAHRLLHDKYLNTEFQIETDTVHYSDDDIFKCISHLEAVWHKIMQEAQDLYKYPKWTYHNQPLQ